MGPGLALVLAAEALFVETGSPDALCPELAQTRRAVAERLGALETPGGRWVARYTMLHAPDSAAGDFVELTLTDAEGRLRLERKLPLRGESCRTMAQVIAMVLDSYFRDLANASSALRQGESVPGEAPGEEVRPDRTAPSPASAQAPVAPTDPVPSSGSAARSYGSEQGRAPGQASLDASSASGRASPRPMLGGGVGFAAPPRSAAVGVRAGFALGAHVRTDASLVLPTGKAAQTQPIAWIEDGRRMEQEVHLEEWVFPARLSVAFGADTRRLSAFIGPELLFAFNTAKSDAPEEPGQGWRVVPGFGVTAWLGLHMSPALEIGARGSADRAFASLTNRLEVEGQEVLRPDPIQGLVSLEAVFWLGR
jgi:hypothetical protein